jgi:hypothetical protein
VTVEDIINGRTLNHDVARRNIEAQYSPSQMAEFEGKAEVASSTCLELAIPHIYP